MTRYSSDAMTTMPSIVAVIMLMVCTSGALLFGWWLRGQRQVLDEERERAEAAVKAGEE